MKVDKETLLKHRFWIGLGAFALLWALLLIFIPVKIGGAAAEQLGKFIKARDDVKKIAAAPKDFANPSWVEPLKKKEDALKTQKDKVWKAAWETQKELMDWPHNRETPLDKELKNAYFLDKIANDQERQTFADTLYAPQWNEFKDAVAPAAWNGGSFEAVLRPVNSWSSSPPTSDECWFAQEDFWVKRDMVGIIREAIETSARFLPDELDAKEKQELPQGVSAQRFHNGSWEVTLLLEMTANKKGSKVLTISPKSTIKNINPDRRRLPLAGVLLEIQQHAKTKAERGTAYLAVEGEPLEWNAAAEIKKAVQVDTFVAADPLEVRQKFNWYTCPVKRVDRIEIGTKAAVSHRTSKWALQPKTSGPKDDTGGGAAGAGAAGSMAAGPMGSGSGAMIMGPMAGGSGGFAGANNQAEGVKVERNRYLDISDQCRRMPVAMTLITDQDHVPDVLAAVANSKLHTWVTQYEWQHVRGIQAPSSTSNPFGQTAEAGGDERPMGSPMRPPMGGGSGAMVRPPMGGGSGAMVRPPMGGGSMGMMTPAGAYGEVPSSFFSAGGEGAEQDDPNLVELTVYGIASLYERYPPKAPSDEGQQTPGGKPSPDATPAAPTAPAAPNAAETSTPTEAPKPAPAAKPEEAPAPTDTPKPAEAPKPADTPATKP
jgi:hypothetical protein